MKLKIQAQPLATHLYLTISKSTYPLRTKLLKKSPCCSKSLTLSSNSLNLSKITQKGTIKDKTRTLIKNFYLRNQTIQTIQMFLMERSFKGKECSSQSCLKNFMIILMRIIMESHSFMMEIRVCNFLRLMKHKASLSIRLKVTFLPVSTIQFFKNSFKQTACQSRWRSHSFHGTNRIISLNRSCRGKYNLRT